MLPRARTVRPMLGVFSKMFKIHFFCCFIAQLVKKLQQWFLYEVKEDILPIVLNTKRPLSNICLLRYKQNSFGCFWKNSEYCFHRENCLFWKFSKSTKKGAQPNWPLRFHLRYFLNSASCLVRETSSANLDFDWGLKARISIDDRQASLNDLPVQSVPKVHCKI